MTYCVGMMVDKGLVLMSDTRTNSGVDNISVFRKMFSWRVEGERIITVMTAGNLATTQAVVSQLEERTKAPDERDNVLLKSPTMFQVASEIGRLLRHTVGQPVDDQIEYCVSRHVVDAAIERVIPGPCLDPLAPRKPFIKFCHALLSR